MFEGAFHRVPMCHTEVMALVFFADMSPFRRFYILPIVYSFLGG